MGVGTGLILVLAAGIRRGSQLEPGDLALFIYYLGFVADFTRILGMDLAHYVQASVWKHCYKEYLCNDSQVPTSCNRNFFLPLRYRKERGKKGNFRGKGKIA